MVAGDTSAAFASLCILNPSRPSFTIIFSAVSLMTRPLFSSFLLNFSQVGLITLTFQVAASLLQPVVGFYTDKKPQPFSLAAGMGFTLTGLVLLSQATSYYFLLVAVALIGIGSSIFHPEASKV